MPMWDTLASDSEIQTVVTNLKANGFEAFVADTGAAAKQKALDILPAGANVMTMTSVTCETIGLYTEINESGKYDSVRKKLTAMDRKTQGREMQALGAAPEWSVGSAHALTETGHMLIASQSGSQLPAHVYGASHVLLVVGAQKVVKDTTAGLQRIYEYVLPLESERAKKAYGVPGSAVNKLLIFNKESVTGRVTVIIVKEKLGF